MKGRAAFEWFFYLREISIAITVKIKEIMKIKTKAGSKERLLLSSVLFFCFASVPNSPRCEAIP